MVDSLGALHSKWLCKRLMTIHSFCPPKSLDWLLIVSPYRQHPYPGIKCHIESVSLLLCAVLDLIQIVLRGNQAISAPLIELLIGGVGDESRTVMMVGIRRL